MLRATRGSIASNAVVITLASALPVYVDRDLLGYELVYAAAGLPECVFPIAPQELVVLRLRARACICP